MTVLNSDQIVALYKALDCVKDEQTRLLLTQAIKICMQQRALAGVTD